MAALTQDDPEIQDFMCGQQGAVLAYHGHLRQARTMSRRAADLARDSDHLESAAQHQAGAAVREALFGFRAEARHSALSTLGLSNGRDLAFATAIALAFSGDDSRAQSVADDFEKRYPEDTLIRFLYVPTLRAIVAENHRRFSKAIELLESAAPYELGWEGCCSVGFIPSLYPIYVRGLVYLAAHQGRQAAAEFQKILEHREIVTTDPIGALARLQLGRAYALAGDNVRAKAAYDDFLALWKDADPDIPILKEAKAEYAKL